MKILVHEEPVPEFISNCGVVELGSVTESC
jgi:hypothetical protein